MVVTVPTNSFMLHTARYKLYFCTYLLYLNFGLFAVKMSESEVKAETAGEKMEVLICFKKEL